MFLAEKNYILAHVPPLQGIGFYITIQVKLSGMEQPEDKPKSTGGLSKTSPRSTGGLLKTSPLSQHGSLLTYLELYAFYVVFALLLIASFVVTQQILDEWELSILLFVVLPFLAWSVRIILKTG